MPADSGTERVLGIPFFTGTLGEAVERHVPAGGYVVIPAAPALIKLNYDEEYRRALQNADLALIDSGLVVLLWRIVAGRKLNRISGIAYFKHLLAHDLIKQGNDSFWIFASEIERAKAAEWLRGQGIDLANRNCFIAACAASSAQDYEILTRIEEEKPKHVVIAVSGGNQEKLALYLRDFLLFRPAIHCIGAALALLSGEQKTIPDWAERNRLGWFFRLLAQPRMIFPRIGIAIALARMIFKYRSDLPPLKKRWADI
jgi:exopolysaccharide biosynthesis WecB/TagA/CpsF family protein